MLFDGFHNQPGISPQKKTKKQKKLKARKVEEKSVL